MLRKRKDGFVNHVSDVLQNSMITGIPQIASAGNWPNRIIRSLVFCLCLGGFVYQSLEFMSVYWKYDVVVDVQVSNPMYVDRPSITVCIFNGFKSQEFCEDPETESLRKEKHINCTKLEITKNYYDWCKCNPRLCDRKGNLKNLTRVDRCCYDTLYNMPRDQIRKYLLTPKEFMWLCQEHGMRELTVRDLEDCEDKYIPQIPCQYDVQYEREPESCFTLNSLIGRPNHTVDKVFTDGEIRLYLKTNEDRMPYYTKRNTLHISIHNPYQVENPFTTGFVMIAGNQYTYRMKRVVTNRLPHPYSTDCKDYRSLWKARGGRGPTNFKECILECHKNLSMAKYGCILSNIYLPSEEKRCGFTIRDKSLYKPRAECAQKNCKPACDEEYYIVTQDIAEEGDVNCYKDEYKRTSNMATVFIKLDGMETTSYIYSPKYQDIEMFSYLGGYIGIWLGISLVAVYDFVESIFVILKYPMTQLLSYKERRKSRDAVMDIQRDL